MSLCEAMIEDLDPGYLLCEAPATYKVLVQPEQMPVMMVSVCDVHRPEA